jgi:hypothetical protein
MEKFVSLYMTQHRDSEDEVVAAAALDRRAVLISIVSINQRIYLRLVL